MNITQVNEIVNKAQVPKEEVDILLSLIKQVPRNLLHGIGVIMSKTDNFPIADSLLHEWTMFLNIYKGLKSGDRNSKTEFLKILEENWMGWDEEKKQNYLYFLMDVRNLSAVVPDLFTRLEFEQLIKKEIYMLWKLPKEEILYLLRYELLLMIDNLNIVSDLQVAINDNYLLYKQSFTADFTGELMQNKQKVGTDNPKTISEWINEFVGFMPTSPTKRNIADIGSFMVKNQSVLKLDEVQKRYISETLKLYIWLLNPDLVEDRVENYRVAKVKSEARQLAEILEKERRKFYQDLGLNPDTVNDDQTTAQPVPVENSSLRASSNLPIAPKVPMPVANGLIKDKVNSSVEKSIQESVSRLTPTNNSNQSSVVRPKLSPLAATKGGANIQDLLRSQFAKAQSQKPGIINQPHEVNVPNSDKWKVMADTKPMPAARTQISIDEKLKKLQDRSKAR